MGSHSSKIISIKTIDELPERLYQIELARAKHEINDQYDSNTSTIYFPQYESCRIYMDGGEGYQILSAGGKRFDSELAAYCKELIQRPYILVGRTVYLVENCE